MSVVDTIGTIVDETEKVLDPSVSILDAGAAFLGEKGAFVEVRPAPTGWVALGLTEFRSYLGPILARKISSDPAA